jgi:hypothetical protein
MKDAMIYLPNATHEIVLECLNPEYYPPDLNNIPKYRLTPINFAAQFISTDDENAKKFVESRAITNIAMGSLSPDTDYRSEWERIFGDNMIKKRGVLGY